MPSSSSGEILCFGGTTIVSVTATGGTPPYLGTGDFEVTAGTYTYDVTDANGCTFSTTITIEQPPLLTVSTDGCGLVYAGAGAEYGCASISTIVAGGVPGYTFEWSNTETSEGITVCPDSTASYSVTVTDANGCTADADWTVEVLDISCTRVVLVLVLVLATHQALHLEAEVVLDLHLQKWFWICIWKRKWFW